MLPQYLQYFNTLLPIICRFNSLPHLWQVLVLLMSFIFQLPYANIITGSNRTVPVTVQYPQFTHSYHIPDVTPTCHAKMPHTQGMFLS